MPLPAHAQEAPAVPVYADPDRKAPRLAYVRGPAECLSEEDFRREVAIWLDGRDHFDSTAPDVLSVRFEKGGAGYHGIVTYTDANGVTEPPDVQTSDNCEVLARWVALSASGFIPRRLTRAAVRDPAAARPPPCSSCETSPPGPWVPPVLPPQRFEPRRPPEKEMDVTIGLSGLVLMTAGFTANVGPGFGLMADVRYGWFSFGLEARGIFPGRVYAREPIFPDDPTKATREQEGDLSQWTVALVPCGRWKYLFGCVVGQLGGIVHQDALAMDVSFNLNLGPRLGVEVPITERFAIFGFGDALFATQLMVVNYNIDNDVPAANTRWVQSPVSGFFGAGATVLFK